jgi:hypothetical protein
MKKLNLLKTIVDYVWLLSVIFYPLIIVFGIMVSFDHDSFDIPITIGSSTIDAATTTGKVALGVVILNFGVLLIALWYFKKLLQNFQKRQIFDAINCSLLNKIGTFILIGALLYLVSDLCTKFAKHQIGIELGYGPFLYLLALGLFFKVLSEVFKMAQTLKEENELTI